MRAIVAIGLLLAGIPAVGAVAATDSSVSARASNREVQGSATAYQLTAQVPARIRQGEPASLVLHVEKTGQPPAGDVAACLATAPLFPSEEDASDTTPALGMDLGVGAESSSQSGCVMGIAGVRSAPGAYQFTWEPDTAGRVNLRFSVGDSLLNVLVNVESAPPSPAILIGFLLLVVVILSAAGWMRHAQKRHGGST